MLTKKKYFIFDWNGTLVDDAWIFVDILNELLAARGLNKITLKDYRNQFCFPIKLFYKNLGVDVSKGSFIRLEQEFIKAYYQRMYKPKLFHGIIAVLTELLNRGFGLSILSASHNDVLSSLVNHYRLNEYFDYVIGVNNYGAKGKINSGKDLLKNININKEKIVMIGDTGYDFQVAQALGLDCLLVSWGHQSDNQLTKSTSSIINSLNDLIMLL